MRLVQLAAAASLVVCAACTSSSQPPQTGQAGAGGSGIGFLSQLNGQGFVYLLAGSSDADLAIVEYDLGDGDRTVVSPVPTGFGVSSFSASTAGIALAWPGSGRLDRIGLLDGATVHLLPPAIGTSPSISAAGAILKLRLGARHATILIHDRVGTGWRTVLTGGTYLSNAVWRNGSTAAVSTKAQGRGEGTIELVNVRTGRVTARLSPHQGPLSPLAEPYPRRQPLTWIALRQADRSGYVDQGSTIDLPPGWSPTCWDPAGRVLLVRRRHTFGIVTRDTPSRVARIGTSDAVIYDGAWLTDRPPGVR